MSVWMNPPADIVGDVRNWRSMGLAEGSFDAIVSFEVVEHVDCFRECYDLLRPGGIMCALHRHLDGIGCFKSLKRSGLIKSERVRTTI